MFLTTTNCGSPNVPTLWPPNVSFPGETKMLGGGGGGVVVVVVEIVVELVDVLVEVGGGGGGWLPPK